MVKNTLTFTLITPIAAAVVQRVVTNYMVGLGRLYHLPEVEAAEVKVAQTCRTINLLHISAPYHDSVTDTSVVSLALNRKLQGGNMGEVMYGHQKFADKE